METKRPILVGIDFSPCSEWALVQAEHIAARLGAGLVCVHVINEHVLAHLAVLRGVSMERLEEEARRSAALRFRQLVRPGAAMRGGPPLMVVGHPGEVLVQQASEHGASMLVLGAHSTSGGPEPGSIAMACVRHAPADVLLVRDTVVKPLHSVLACTGLGPNSDQVVARAAALVAPRGALHLLHVMDPPWKKFHLRDPGMESSQETRDRYKHSVQDQLDRAVALVRRQRPDLELTPVLVQSGSPSSAIMTYTTEHRPRLIAVGNRSRGFLETLLLGSTATRVLRKARCAVLAVEPHRRADQASGGGDTSSPSPVS